MNYLTDRIESVRSGLLVSKSNFADDGFGNLIVVPTEQFNFVIKQILSNLFII